MSYERGGKMSISERKREEHHCRALERIGSVLLCIAFLLAAAFPPAPALAFVGVDDAAIASITAAFLSSCGITFQTTGMTSNGVKEQVGRLIDNYLTEEHGGKTPVEWLGQFAVDYHQAQISLPGLVASKLSDFARWVTNEFASDGTVLSSTVSTMPTGDGGSIEVTTVDDSDVIVYLGANVEAGTVFPNGFRLISNGDYVQLVNNAGSVISQWYTNQQLVVVPYNGGLALRMYLPGVGIVGTPYMVSADPAVEQREEMSLDVTNPSIPNAIPDDEMIVLDLRNVSDMPAAAASDGTLEAAVQAIVDAIAAGQIDDNAALDDAVQAIIDAIEAGKIAQPGAGATLDDALAAILEAIAAGQISEAALPGTQLDAALQAILEAIAAGQVQDPVTGAALDAALERILEAIAAGQIAIPQPYVKPEEEVKPVNPSVALPDIATLGLPALGDALTSKFPFSIPWDVAKAIRLLAVPAKTPRFEIDFMAPIAYRFGGFPGDTMIVLDFSEYEIIGQVSRWASTIGFCLLLASGTKKLIWTA